MVRIILKHIVSMHVTVSQPTNMKSMHYYVTGSKITIVTTYSPEWVNIEHRANCMYKTNQSTFPATNEATRGAMHAPEVTPWLTEPSWGVNNTELGLIHHIMDSVSSTITNISYSTGWQWCCLGALCLQKAVLLWHDSKHYHACKFIW